MSIRNSAPDYPNRLRAVLATGMMREFTYDDRKGYKVERDGVLQRNVTGDGSCLYYSLASLLAGGHVDAYSSPANATKLKAEIKGYIDKNWERMKAHHDIKDGKQEYLNAMENRWGGPVELDAAAELYGVVIFEWTSGSNIEPDRIILSDEQALARHAVLRARYYPSRLGPNPTKDEFKKLRRLDVFLHNNHYRYIKKVQQTPDASNSEEPNRPTREEIQNYLKKNKRGPNPPASTMNDQLKKLAVEREKRMQGDVCEKDGILSDKEIAQRLQEQEYRLAEDHLKALRLQYEEY